MAGSRDGRCGEQHHEQLEELRRRNEEAEMAKAFQRGMWREEYENAPPYVLSLETARVSSRHQLPVDDDATLPDGWVRSAANIPVAPRLSGEERIDFLKRKWMEMSYEQKLDPKYSISAPYWHVVVDAEYEARRIGVFLPTAAREPTPELSASDDDRSDGEDDDDDPELTDLPLPPAGASWSAASPSPEKGAQDEAGEASHQACRDTQRR